MLAYDRSANELCCCKDMPSLLRKYLHLFGSRGGSAWKISRRTNENKDSLKWQNGERMNMREHVGYTRQDTFLQAIETDAS